MAWPMSRPKGRTSIGVSCTASLEMPLTCCYSTAKKAKTLNMFTGGKAQRNASGKVTKAADYQSRDLRPGLIAPNRKWFGNTRVISQDALQSFREAIAERTADPYQVLLKTNKLPLSLIREPVGKNGLKQHQAKVAVETSSFGDTFGPKAQRKRVKIAAGSLEDLAEETSKMHDTYKIKTENDRIANGILQEQQAGEGVPEDEATATAREPIFSKGKSKRIFNELYKVLDASDVVIEVLDSRDPIGTRCRSAEKYIQEEAPHKHLILLLNKCDLIPTKCAVSASIASVLLATLVFGLKCTVSHLPSLSQGAFRHSLALDSGSSACYNFGTSTLLSPLLPSGA